MAKKKPDYEAPKKPDSSPMKAKAKTSSPKGGGKAKKGMKGC